MMLKNLSNYIKFSGLWAGVAVNPYHWEFRIATQQPDDLNPNIHGFFISVGPLWIRGSIDDGSW